MNYSKQRDAILNYLLNIKTHPTAESIHKELLIDNPELSLGTVYRNLDKLSESGLICRLKGYGNKDRFDGNIKPHYHAECEKCGEIVDIFLDYMSNIDNEVKDNMNLDVVSHEIKFNIICPNCK